MKLRERNLKFSEETWNLAEKTWNFMKYTLNLAEELEIWNFEPDKQQVEWGEPNKKLEVQQMIFVTMSNISKYKSNFIFWRIKGHSFSQFGLWPVY